MYFNKTIIKTVFSEGIVWANLLFLRNVKMGFLVLFFLVVSFAVANTNFMGAATSVGFIQNKGQVQDEDGRPVNSVLYKATINDVELYITTYGLTYVFKKYEEEKKDLEINRDMGSMDWARKCDIYRLDVAMLNAAISKENIVAENPLAKGFYNYYYPGFAEGITGLVPYRKITVKNIYPGIDWVLYSNNKGIKYDFIVHPGADASLIQMQYIGAEEILIDKNNFRIKTPLGIIGEDSLQCFVSGNTKKIKSHYVLSDNNIISFKLGRYNKNETAVIDPPLFWATYFGGGGVDGVMSMAMDNAGSVYLSGYSSGSTFPTKVMAGAYNQSFSGNGDAFILKFDNAGVWLWSTFFGGSSSGEEANDITIDGAGNIYVVGRSGSNNMPTRNLTGAYNQAATGGGSFWGDAFILKLNSAGAWQWCTYYGGSDDDAGRSVHTDAADNVYMTGWTKSTNFPLQNLGGAYNQATNGGAMDVFIIKFSNTGARLWATYYGGSADDRPYDIKVNGNDFFVTGSTKSTGNFPIQNLAGAYNSAVSTGGQDAFILKCSTSGARSWCTYYGGSNDENGLGITMNATGDIFIAGNTRSSDLPVTNLPGAYNQATHGGGISDHFILKLNSVCSAVWSTYFGGNKEESEINYGGQMITCDAAGNVYFTGGTSSTNFILQNPGGGVYFKNAHSSLGLPGTDLFITQFDNAGAVYWSTYYGGNDDSWGTAILPDAAGCVFVTGEWWSTSGVNTLNPGSGAYYAANNSSNAPAKDDGFVVKFCPTPTPPLITVTTFTNVLCNGSNTGVASASPIGGTPGYTYSWSTNPTQTTATATGLIPGTYTVIVTDNVGTTSISTFTITQPNALSSSITQQVHETCFGDSIGIAGIKPSGGTPGFTYSWSTLPAQTQDVATGLKAGTYTVTFTDVNNCTGTSTITITEPPAITATVSPAGICIGQTAVITAVAAGGTPGYTYSWHGGSIGSTYTVTPTVNTNYTISITDSKNCIAIQVVTVSVSPVPVIIPSADTMVCAGNAVLLSCSGASTYAWSPSSGLSSTTGTSVTVTNTATTTYTITGSVNGCNNDTVVTVNINDNPTITSTLTDAHCNATDGTAIAVATGGTGNYTYLWSNSYTGNAVTGLAAGTYTLNVTDSLGCNQSHTVTINSLPGPTADAGNSVTIIQGASATLSANGGVTYSWYPSTGLSCTTCSNPVASPTVTTKYFVVASDSNGCTSLDSVLVTVEVLCAEIYLPNVFSPNNDGQNDSYGPIVTGAADNFYLVIYNRWGQKVFETTDVNYKWDGKFNGADTDSGVFDFICKYSCKSNEQNKKGTLTLIR